MHEVKAEESSQVSNTNNDQLEPLVSIVVPTRNEAPNIRLCLESIRLQTYSRIEVIVVDNFSTDGTADLAMLSADRVVSAGPERSAQRNRGLLDWASGTIFGYIDADMILGPLVVEHAVERIQQGFGGVYVPEIVLGTRWSSRIRRHERLFYDGTVIDAMRFFKSEDFLAVGGFDESLFRMGSGEDWDLDQLLLTRGVRPFVQTRATDAELMLGWPLFAACSGVTPTDPGAIYHNESDLRIRQYLSKKTYYAKGFSGYISKWGSTNPAVSRQFSPWYRVIYVFMEQGKWRFALCHPLRSLGVVALRLLVGTTYLVHRFASTIRKGL